LGRVFCVSVLAATFLVAALVRPSFRALAATVATRFDVVFAVPACANALAATVLAALLAVGLRRIPDAVVATRLLVFSPFAMVFSGLTLRFDELV